MSPAPDGGHQTAGAPLRAEDPRRLGDYALVGRLGEGRHGVAYLGRTHDGDAVTVRVPRGGWAPGQRARFLADAELAQQVTAPPVARVLDAQASGDRPYLVSEFVDGPSLQRLVQERGPLEGTKLDRMALRTARALAAVHRAGLVHHDFKPGNVLLGPDGIKVADLGLAQLTDHHAQPGTPAYLAPEQIEDEPAGPPADVFAWGAVMVYAAGGRPPFGTGPSVTVMRRVTSRPPELGDLEGHLRELVILSLDKNPAARPTAGQLVRALRDGVLPPAKPKPKRIPHYRWRMMVALAVVILLGFALGALLPTH